MKVKRPDAGTTAVIVLVVENTIYCANVGDSRAVICENSKAFPLMEDHNPSLKREVERIEKSGGCVVNGRVGMKLAITRAIGDFNFKMDRNRSATE